MDESGLNKHIIDAPKVGDHKVNIAVVGIELYRGKNDWVLDVENDEDFQNAEN